MQAGPFARYGYALFLPEFVECEEEERYDADNDGYLLVPQRAHEHDDRGDDRQCSFVFVIHIN